MLDGKNCFTLAITVLIVIVIMIILKQLLSFFEHLPCTRHFYFNIFTAAMEDRCYYSIFNAEIYNIIIRI